MFSFSLFERCILNLNWAFLMLSPSTISPHGTTCSIDYPQSLCILNKFLDIWVFIHPPSLALLTKKVFQRVLADPVAHKHCHSWYGKNEFDQVYKCQNCMYKKSIEKRTLKAINVSYYTELCTEYNVKELPVSRSPKRVSLASHLSKKAMNSSCSH